jgi:hypothetical protein
MTALKEMQRARIWQPMMRRLLRPLLALLVAIALAGAPIAAQAAMPCHGSCDAPIATHGGVSGLPDPCQGMIPGCMNALTCFSIVTLPALQSPTRPELTELRVAYWPGIPAVHGRSVAPGLDPPIAS